MGARRPKLPKFVGVKTATFLPTHHNPLPPPSLTIRNAPLLQFYLHLSRHLESPQSAGRNVQTLRTAAAVREAATDSASLNSLESGNGRLTPPQPAANGAPVADASAVLSYAPEDFTLAPGEPSLIDRTTPADPADVFRCAGCTEPACQVRLP